MGASGWSYFTPYQEDSTQALQELRQKVFEEGAYQKFWLYSEVPEVGFDEIEKWEEDEWNHSDQQVLETLAQLLEQKQISAVLPKAPQTIEEVLKRNGSVGTHSILDIDRIASQPEDNAAVAMPETLLMKYFGTTRPTRAMVETAAAASHLDDFLWRWQATFLVVYQEDFPSELFFCGSSGD